MHPYIPYLIADLEAAHRERVVYKSSYSSEEEVYLEEIQRWVDRDAPDQTFGYHCGLKTIDFPPPGQLSPEDMKLVCEAFKKLLFSWNTRVHLPYTLPVDLQYQFMIKILEEEFSPMSSGFLNFDFCAGYPPDCALKEHCPCLLIWDESILD